MKNSKLKIDQLKVSSFVTDFSEGEKNTVKGGSFTTMGMQCTNIESLDWCPSDYCPTRKCPKQ
ncbi:MAG: pinensin family lanthipeptide [Bacteroidota bacterium]